MFSSLFFFMMMLSNYGFSASAGIRCQIEDLLDPHAVYWGYGDRKPKAVKEMFMACRQYYGEEYCTQNFEEKNYHCFLLEDMSQI
ncbi:MAG: hypothetical protein C5B49_09860 [Bdellovibrio sp.]|nr:MAG: hypothetical protein C5B49_09860 [Bdellovibrio sp.]